MSHNKFDPTFLLIFFSFILCHFTPHAQSFQWVTQTGNTYSETVESMQVDQDENVYIVGSFVGTVDFDPGAGVVNLSTNSVFTREYFITKTDSNGHLIWAKKFDNTSGGVNMTNCQINSNQEVYIVGSVSGTVDFDPGTGVSSVTASNAMYVVKLNQNGDFLWVKTMSSTSNAKITHINIDSSDNLYCSGSFAGSIDFDPYAGITSLTSVSIYSDLFIAKYDSSLHLIWVKAINSNDNKSIADIGIDAGGAVTMCGTFESTIDVDPSAVVLNMTVTGSISSDQDVFILQLDQNGNFNWAKQLGNTMSNYISSLQINSAGDVLAAGDFSGTLDFDPGAGITSLTASFAGVYILKLDHNGNFNWVKQMGGNSFTYCKSISLDNAENIYATGSTAYTIDFDPGTAVVNFTSVGEDDIYLLKLDMNGNFIWVKQIGGLADEEGDRIHVASSNNIYTSGIFKDTADFNPGLGIHLLDPAGPSGFSGNFDNFILKLRQCVETNSTLTTTACDQYIFNGSTYTNSGIYQQVLVNSGGCDSIVELQLTIQTSSSNTITQTACDLYTFNGTTYTNSGVYSHSYINSNGCDSIVMLNLTINSSDSISLFSSGCDSYVFNSQTYTTSGIYSHSFTNTNGCDSTVLLNLTISNSDSDTLSVSACDTYTFNGQTYTTSGSYSHTFTNSSSCDSIVLLQLQIVNSDSNTVTQTACDSYTFLSQTYTTSGVYSFTLMNTAGCDSVVSLDLTINTLSATISQAGNSLTAMPSGATYQWIQCPSNNILTGVTMQNFNVLIDGLYAVIVTQNGCVDTSACVDVKGVGLNYVNKENIVTIYPNPTYGICNLSFNSSLNDATIRLIAMDGSIIVSKNNISGTSSLLNISTIPTGIYLLEIVTNDKTYRSKLIKE